MTARLVNRGLFAPDSLGWRINRDAVLLLGGGRALLMQIANPLIAAGVAAHSTFRKRPWERLLETLDTMAKIVFGNVAEAEAAYRRIDAIHGRVQGSLAEPVGRYPSNTRYSARDPTLLLWVYATLVDTALLIYDRYAEPLSAAERARYYCESTRLAHFFRIPRDLIPKDFPSFQRYMSHSLTGDFLAVSPEAKAMAEYIIQPPLASFWEKSLTRMLGIITIGVLPPRIRAEYGFSWGPDQRLKFELTEAKIRAVLALLPLPLRTVPMARTNQRIALVGPL